MKLLLLSPQPFFASRGTPMNVRTVVEGLAALGHQVHLLAYPMGEDVELPEGVTVHRSPRIPFIRSIPIGFSIRKLLMDIPFAVSAFIIARMFEVDVLSGVEEGAFVAGSVGLLLRKPYAIDIDSCLIDQLRTTGAARVPLLLRAISAVEKFFVRRATCAVTVCQALSDNVRAVNANLPIFQIEDCPQEAALIPQPELVSRIIQRWGLAGKKVVVYTGNLEGYQGIELLLVSFQHFLLGLKLDERDNVRLLLVGGKAEDVLHYKGRARELGIIAQVIMVGSVPVEEVGSYLELADILVSPRTVGANTPLKIYTYMATGTPIVATNLSTHTQVLNEELAFLAEPTPESFSEALQLALESSEVGEMRRQHIGEAARSIVETYYSKAAFDERLKIFSDFLHELELGRAPLANPIAERIEIAVGEED